MKLGVKYLCKKSHKFNYCSVIENNFYKIDYLNYFWISISIENNCGITFSNKNNGWVFYDYFYTKQEERKLKLEKICLNQEI